MPDETYVLLSDEDFECLEAAEKFLVLATDLWSGVTTAPHLTEHYVALTNIAQALCDALTADAHKDADLEEALEVSWRDDTDREK